MEDVSGLEWNAMIDLLMQSNAEIFHWQTFSKRCDRCEACEECRRLGEPLC